MPLRITAGRQSISPDSIHALTVQWAASAAVRKRPCRSPAAAACHGGSRSRDAPHRRWQRRPAAQTLALLPHQRRPHCCAAACCCHAAPPAALDRRPSLPFSRLCSGRMRARCQREKEAKEMPQSRSAFGSPAKIILFGARLWPQVAGKPEMPKNFEFSTFLAVRTNAGDGHGGPAVAVTLSRRTGRGARGCLLCRPGGGRDRADRRRRRQERERELESGSCGFFFPFQPISP